MGSLACKSFMASRIEIYGRAQAGRLPAGKGGLLAVPGLGTEDYFATGRGLPNHLIKGDFLQLARIFLHLL